MCKKSAIPRDVFFSLVFIAVSVLQGAQSPGGEGFGEESFCEKQVTCVMPGRPKRTMELFNVGDDKEGFLHVEKNIVDKQIALIDYISREKVADFDAVEAQAMTIFGNRNKFTVWGQIANTVRQSRYVAVDSAGRRFVVCADPVPRCPQESIEKAIYRACQEYHSIQKRDLVLRLYSEGYQDYTYQSIVAKRTVLTCLGFCPNFFIHGDTLAFLRECWTAINRGSNQDRRDIFCNCAHKDIDIVFQMVYMQKHGLIEALGQEIENNSGEVFGNALRRQNKILQYLKDRIDQPCKVLDITQSVLTEHDLPKGVVHEIASLVFLGKAVVSFDFEEETCTLLSQSALPVGAEELCDELVFFQNLRKHTQVAQAILKTYLRGYKKHPPEKMNLFKSSFDLMNVAGNVSGRSVQILEEFLQKHAYIPPVWRWDAAMEERGRILRLTFYDRILDAVFDMHNRGTLSLVQTYARVVQKPHFCMENTLPPTKERLCCDDPPCGLKGLAQLLEQTDNKGSGKKNNDWAIVLDGVGGFIRHVYYNVETDEFSWIEDPKSLDDKTEYAGIKEMCLLKNRYPGISVRCLTFLLLHKGFAMSHERIHLLSQSLEVAGLVRSHKDKKYTACIQRRKEVFLALKNCQNKESLARIYASIKNDSRAERVVMDALNFCEDEGLKALTNIPFVQKCGRGVYKRSCPSDDYPLVKKHRSDSAVRIIDVEPEDRLEHKQCAGSTGLNLLWKAVHEIEGDFPS